MEPKVGKSQSWSKHLTTVTDNPICSNPHLNDFASLASIARGKCIHIWWFQQTVLLPYHHSSPLFQSSWRSMHNPPTGFLMIAQSIDEWRKNRCSGFFKQGLDGYWCCFNQDRLQKGKEAKLQIWSGCNLNSVELTCIVCQENWFLWPPAFGNSSRLYKNSPSRTARVASGSITGLIEAFRPATLLVCSLKYWGKCLTVWKVQRMLHSLSWFCPIAQNRDKY